MSMSQEPLEIKLLLFLTVFINLKGRKSFPVARNWNKIQLFWIDARSLSCFLVAVIVCKSGFGCIILEEEVAAKNVLHQKSFVSSWCHCGDAGWMDGMPNPLRSWGARRRHGKPYSRVALLLWLSVVLSRFLLMDLILAAEKRRKASGIWTSRKGRETAETRHGRLTEENK